MVRVPADGWHKYRIPKGSYTHDSYSGWYTEWPRIRDVGLGNGQFLMNQHALMYRFPSGFDPAHTGGLLPVSNFLKMIVDYADFSGRIVMGCDDVSSFNNALYGRVHSNFSFVEKAALDSYGGPAHGFGGVWLNEAVAAGVPSDPFLVNGFGKRVVHMAHNSGQEVNFTIEMDMAGDGTWLAYKTVAVPAAGYAAEILPAGFPGQWIRFTPDRAVSSASAYMNLRGTARPEDFALTASLARPNPTAPISQGVIKVTSASDYPLEFAADLLDSTGNITGTGYYKARLNASRKVVLEKVADPAAESALRTAALTKQDFTVDNASVVMLSGSIRYRLPKGNAAFDSATASGWRRGIREVVSERSLMNIHGTFYELPRSDSAGMIRIRPVTTHNRQIFDFASWRGLLAISGNLTGSVADEHYLVSDDGLAGLWLGSVDDLWRMGEPRGIGGPWKDSVVAAGTASDAYLMAGYDYKELNLSHTSASPVVFTVEVDFAANNSWSSYGAFTVQPGEVFRHVFPPGYSAHWVRLKAGTATTASAQFAFGPAEATDAFGQWVRDNGLPATQDRAVLVAADSDRDGLANLMEFALALDPNAGSVVPASLVRNDAALEYTYVRNKAAVSGGVIFNVEWSDTLASGSWTSVGAGVVQIDNGNLETVKAIVPAGSGPKRFVRLKVSTP